MGSLLYWGLPTVWSSSTVHSPSPFCTVPSHRPSPPTSSGTRLHESAFNFSLSFGSCLLKFLSFPKKIIIHVSLFSYLPLSPSCLTQVSQKESQCLMSNLLYFSGPDLPTSELLLSMPSVPTIPFPHHCNSACSIG